MAIRGANQHGNGCWLGKGIQSAPAPSRVSLSLFFGMQPTP